ncbi:alpha/beta-hydrolase [Multifurca ochricompacta]|uniref:Alpha/beta-hydrolase n=1 Tax=Multifurca ochricompacta TaxID=376703 RepID=A0AAD4LYE7_9AGAM|nr:alpha/beta-hydrolase [Multifurca ochricompacta]
MSNDNWKKLGVFAFLDTGPPFANRKDYSTLVMLHGLSATAGFFKHFFPLAKNVGARIILINRREYPGSDPFSDQDHALIASATHDTPEASENANLFMKARTKELYDFLCELVRSEDLLTNSIILAGWSLGAAFMTAFLTYAPTFEADEIELSRYIRRVIVYDPPSIALGYPAPDGYYYPFNDPSISLDEGMKTFPLWATGYYAHGETLETLSRTALDDPRPTILVMSVEDIGMAICVPPSLSDGVDMLLLQNGSKNGLFARLRMTALFVPDGTGEGWSNVEFRYFWCDRSVWPIISGIQSFIAETETARQLGKLVRKHSIVRMNGANHCAHWDEPERTLKLLVSDD